jgi:hypothetical protein
MELGLLPTFYGMAKMGFLLHSAISTRWPLQCDA